MARERAFRRYQMLLAKQRARYIMRAFWGIEEPTPTRVGSIASVHGRPCSCWMCQNPRRHGDLTRQEIISAVSEKEQCEEHLTQ